jgi:hypothetical protein
MLAASKSLADGFGYAGGIMLAICMMPQIYHMWKKKVLY